MMNHESGKRTIYDVSVSCVPAQPPCFSENLPIGLSQPSILIVDDDENCRELLCAILENRGCFCLRAENGKSALKVIQESRVALIITDFQMPVLDGCEFLEQLSRDHTRPPPAYMITGNLTEKIRDRALKAGAVMVLPKPIDRNVLLTLVKQYLGRQNRIF